MAQRINFPLSVESIVKGITYLTGTLGFLSVWRHIGLPYSVAFLALCIFSIYLEFRKAFFIPRWVLNMLSLSVLAFSLFRLRSEDLVTTTLEALVILIGIKFLEEKKFRDYMQIYLITIFLLSGSSLLSSDIVFLAYLFCLVFLLTPAIVLLTYLSQDATLKLDRGVLTKIILKSLLIPALAVPFTVFMFLVLPRTNYPLLNFLNKGDRAKTGFTDNVTLGGISEIQEDASIIFRAHMERVDSASLYWRGVVFDHFDGKQWRASGKNGREQPRISALKGKRIEQTIYLEPYENRYLFAADKPVAISMRGAITKGDLTFSLPENVGRRILYEAVSVLSGTLPEEDADTSIYLQLPKNTLPEISDLALELSLHKDPAEAIKAITTFLAKGNYIYSSKNLPLTDDPLRDFIFRYKYGNCEYFASALAVMLRTAGVPARIVGGYLGGYYNDIGKYYAVPQKNAHVWVEAYLKNEGWVRVDPTPASPDFFTAAGGGIRLKAKLLFDTVNYYWNAAIINYNFRKQLSLLRKFRSGLTKPTIRVSFKRYEVIKYAALLLLVISALSTLYYGIRFPGKSVEEKMIGRFLKRMGRHGYKKKRSEGLEEFVSGIADKELREKALIFVKEFEEHYYRDKRLTKEVVRNLKKIIKRLQ